MVGGLLYLCTPFQEAIALDPVTGKEVWRYEVGSPMTASPERLPRPRLGPHPRSRREE